MVHSSLAFSMIYYKDKNRIVNTISINIKIKKHDVSEKRFFGVFPLVSGFQK